MWHGISHSHWGCPLTIGLMGIHKHLAKAMLDEKAPRSGEGCMSDTEVIHLHQARRTATPILTTSQKLWNQQRDSINSATVFYTLELCCKSNSAILEMRSGSKHDWKNRCLFLLLSAMFQCCMVSSCKVGLRWWLDTLTQAFPK
jgi:hypothetical protein